MNNQFIIGTGFWVGKGWRNETDADNEKKVQFFYTWDSIIAKTFGDYIGSEDIYVIDNNSTRIPTHYHHINWLTMKYNLGHAHDLDKSNAHKLCGWSATFIQLCMIAYANNKDLIFIEQDCLAFGDIVNKIYGMNKEFLVGTEAFPGLKLEQSLVYVKHSFLLQFIQDFLAINNPDGGNNSIRPEIKFWMIMQNHKERCGFLPFGYGRTRPKDYREETFYIQQINNKDIVELTKAGKL